MHQSYGEPFAKAAVTRTLLLKDNKRLKTPFGHSSLDWRFVIACAAFFWIARKMETHGKAHKIRKLNQSGFDFGEIAKIVRCRREYVRMVLQRERHGGLTPSELRWQARKSKSERHRKYAQKRLEEMA